MNITGIGLRHPKDNSDTPDRTVLIVFHGNGEVIENYVKTSFRADLFDTCCIDLFLFEYRGYGYFSTESHPDLIGILTDLKSVYETLTNMGMYYQCPFRIERSLGYEERNMVVMGRSLGSLFAVEYASRHTKIAGLIIESGFSRIDDFLIKRWKHRFHKEGNQIPDRAE